jgi:hypothetical protein
VIKKRVREINFSGAVDMVNGGFYNRMFDYGTENIG